MTKKRLKDHMEKYKTELIKIIEENPPYTIFTNQGLVNKLNNRIGGNFKIKTRNFSKVTMGISYKYSKFIKHQLLGESAKIIFIKKDNKYFSPHSVLGRKNHG